MVCAGCRASRDAPPTQSGELRLPKGWKRLGGETLCPKCREDRYCIRVVRLPVAAVVGEDNSPDSQRDAKNRFWNSLRLSWRQATELCNWALTEHAKADSEPLIPGPNGPKLPPRPKLSLYQPARSRWPEIDSQSLADLLQRVQAKYGQSRFDLRCRSAISLPTYRYPLPLPIPAACATFLLVDGACHLRIRVFGERFQVRLEGGKRFQRSTNVIRHVIDGFLSHGAISLSAQGSRVMVAIPVNVPKERPSDSSRLCVVKTVPDRLWQVFMDGRDNLWNLNEDQIRRWAAAHHAQLQRLREDCKLDRRLRKPDDLAGRRAVLGRRYAARINDACHKASSMIVGFCERNRVAVVEYDDTERSWMPQFPWFKLRQLCADKLGQAGIRFQLRDSLPESEPTRAVA